MKRARNKPWSKRAPEGPWDCIVVGSGMGGMTTAALLSEIGQRVLVIEQHYVPGGFTHMFKRPGYEWDVGVHAVGEVTERSMTGRLLSRLTRGELEWASLGAVYDELYYPDGLHIGLPDNPGELRHNLVEAFPNEAPAVDDYLAKVRQVARAMKGFYLARTLPRQLAPLADRALAREAQRYLEQGTEQTIAALTDDRRLQSVFTAQWGYYGSVPSRSSFAIQALVVKHFMWGGFYPVGGAKQIAAKLLQTVADGGGWTRVATDVERILVEDGRAVGVRLTDGEEIRAGKVVSAVGVASTVGRLLGDPHRSEPWAQEVLALTPAPAHVCLYIGFKGDITEAGAGAANKWFYGTYSCEQDSWWSVGPDGDIPEAPVLYCSFPSLKDPAYDPGEELRHTGEVVTFVPWSAFAGWRDEPWKKRGADYEQLKARMQQALLDQFLAKMPALRPMVDYVELSTPVSTDKFCRPVQGSIYGLEPTPRRFLCQHLRPRAPIKDLFFSGSEVATVGVIGAMMGGVLAALSAEPLRAIAYLRKVWR